MKNNLLLLENYNYINLLLYIHIIFNNFERSKLLFPILA